MMALGAAAWPAVPAMAADGPAPGVYDGGQTEIAAQLRLGADGRFEYSLAYGALDEVAAGKWVADGACAVLTGDPVTRPQFTLVGTAKAKAGKLGLELQPGEGMEAQYFSYVVLGPDGEVAFDQLKDDRVSVDLHKAKGPLTVRILFPPYQLASDPVPVDPAGGQALTFRFDANDLGKVAFAGERLCDNGDGLELKRFGRTLHFRPVDESDFGPVDESE
jgi:hypothetical protein